MESRVRARARALAHDAGRRTLEWFEVLDELQREGRVVRDGVEVQGEDLLAEYSDMFQLASELVRLSKGKGTVSVCGRAGPGRAG